MQEARDEYAMAKYSGQLGIQGFYDMLINHAQNMSVYPNVYNIMDTLLCGLPKEMCTKMLENGLTPEANTVDNFVSEGKALEAAMKTMEHYNHHSTVPIHRIETPNLQSWDELKLRKVGMTFMKKSDLDNQNHGLKPKIFISPSPSHMFTTMPQKNKNLRTIVHRCCQIEKDKMLE